MKILAATLLAAPTQTADKELDSMGITLGDLGNPFFVQILNGATAQAKKINPDVKITSLSSNYDVNNQTNQIDNFISANIDLLILGAADREGIAPAVRRAKEAGIVVVVGVDATVMSDNRQAGELGAQYIADKLNGKRRSAQLWIEWPVRSVYSKSIPISRCFPRIRTPVASAKVDFE